MTSILRELQKYVPEDSSKKPISIAFGGDQLTVEHARTCEDLRKHSLDSFEQLGGFIPFAADFHAEMVLLQVIITFISMYYFPLSIGIL